MRRVARLGEHAKQGQDELFTSWRYHAFVNNSTLSTVQADEHHRDHAIVEQVIAELKDGTGARPVREVHRKRRLAHPRHDRVQPPAGRRCRRLPPARARPVGHPAQPPHRRPRPDRHQRTTPGPAPAPGLAVAARLAGPVGHHHHPLTTTAEQCPRNDPTWKSRTDRRTCRAHPQIECETTPRIPTRPRQETPSVDQG